MIQLQSNREPVWREVAPGLRIRLRFGPTEARNAARRHVRETMKANPEADPEFAFVVGCILWAALEWEGVGAPAPEVAEGETPPPPEPAELNADNLSALLRQRPDIYDDLDRSYVDEVVEALSEKNASRPSPNGTSEAGQATAPDATGPAEQSATTRPSDRKAKRASASGA